MFTNWCWCWWCVCTFYKLHTFQLSIYLDSAVLRSALLYHQQTANKISTNPFFGRKFAFAMTTEKCINFAQSQNSNSFVFISWMFNYIFFYVQIMFLHFMFGFWNVDVYMPSLTILITDWSKNACATRIIQISVSNLNSIESNWISRLHFILSDDNDIREWQRGRKRRI